MSVDSAREKSLSDYRKKLMEHKEVEAKLKDLRYYSFSAYAALHMCNIVRRQTNSFIYLDTSILLLNM